MATKEHDERLSRRAENLSEAIGHATAKGRNFVSRWRYDLSLGLLYEVKVLCFTLQVGHHCRVLFRHTGRIFDIKVVLFRPDDNGVHVGQIAHPDELFYFMKEVGLPRFEDVLSLDAYRHYSVSLSSTGDLGL